MKGFEINYNGNITYVAINDGLLMMHIFCLQGESHLYVGGVDYSKQTNVIWYDNLRLNIGDKIDIKFKDIDYVSNFTKYNHDERIKRPFSKLELYLNLEQYLKNKGLL